MEMYNLIEYSDNYSKTSINLWQYYRDELALNDLGANFDFPDDNNDSALFKFKTRKHLDRKIGRTGKVDTKDVQIMVPLKYLRNFCRSLEIPLINCNQFLF